MEKFVSENLIMEIKDSKLILSGLKCSPAGKLTGTGSITYICIGDDKAEILEIAEALMKLAKS